MNSEELILIFEFIASFTISLAGIVFLWVAFKEFRENKNWRYFFFAFGFFIIASDHLAFTMANFSQYHTVFYIINLIAYVLLVLAFSLKRWQYLLISFVFFPFIFNDGALFYFFTTLPLFIIALLAYKNYCRACHLSCDRCLSAVAGQKSEGREWGAAFTFLALATTMVSIEQANLAVNYEIVVHIAEIFFEGLAILIIYRHAFRCIKFNRHERILLPLMMSFILIIVATGFFVNMFITNYEKKQVEAMVETNTKVVQYLAEKDYPSGEFAKKIKTKDVDLNDFVDRVYVKTGIRSAIFLSNERIANTVTTTGHGRLLGSTIDDENVKNSVLQKGESYAGIIEKDGTLFIAAYSPIYDGNNIVGMVATGKPLSEIEKLHNFIFYRIMIGFAAILLVIFGVTAYTQSFKKV